MGVEGSGDPREWRVGEGFARLQEWGLKEARAKGFRESCVGFGVAGCRLKAWVQVEGVRLRGAWRKAQGAGFEVRGSGAQGSAGRIAD